MAKHSSIDLFLCDFPLYSLATLGNNDFYVAGGGGQAKTGVPNAIEIYSLFKRDGCYSCQCILQHGMGENLIMNSETHPKQHGIISAGIGHSNHLFKVLRHSSDHKKGEVQELVFLSSMGFVRTDFKEGDSYQKVVRFNHDGSRIITGGCDGVLRIWKYPDFKDKVELRGHKDEIEDITCHASEDVLVSICRGGEALVWNIENARQMKEFTWQPDDYRLKSCRFSPNKDFQGKHWLYSISIPIRWSQQKRQQCHILKWCTSSWKVQATATMKERACTMAINSDGLKLAIGTTEGSVSIYDNSLKLLVQASKVHSIFVTGLAFIKPESNISKSTNQDDEVVLSISADRTCCVTCLERKDGCGSRLQLILFGLLPLVLFLISIILLAVVV